MTRTFADYVARSDRGELPVRMAVCLDYMFDPENLTPEQRSDPSPRRADGRLQARVQRHRHPGARDGLPVRAGRSGHHLRQRGRAPRCYWHDLPGCLHRPRCCGRLRRCHHHGCYPLGAARGVYSNEAGVGSTIAGHCTADTDHPIRQAQFGIFEVFMDTIVICTITALAVLCLRRVDPGGSELRPAGPGCLSSPCSATSVLSSLP